MCVGQNLNPCPFFVHRSDYSGNNTYYYMECVWFNRDSHPNVGIDADWGLVAQRGLVARESSAFYLVSCRLGFVSPSGSVSPREVCILFDIKNITCILFCLCVKHEYTSVLVRAETLTEVFFPGSFCSDQYRRVLVFNT